MSKRKRAEASEPARVAIAEWALRTARYQELPVTLTQQKPPKKHENWWFNFDTAVNHPITLVDESGAAVHANEAVRMSVKWTALTGSVTVEEFSARADKEGLYWFKKVFPYVLGSFTISFDCPSRPDVVPLARYLPIVPGEGGVVDTLPVANAVALMLPEHRLDWAWMPESAAVPFGAGRTLNLSRYLWTSLRSDLSTCTGANIACRVPPFRPAATDILIAATLRHGSTFSGKEADGSFFCEVMRLLFDEIFESFVLYPSERDYYQNIDIFNQMKKADARPCDMFGGMHLLRFVVCLAAVLSSAEATAPKAAETTRVRSRSSAGAKGSAPLSGAEALSYLGRDSSVRAMEDVLAELEAIYPLARVVAISTR